ncbi:MAG: glycosyltransferase [Acidobacteria bacterium]|nr:glycosyltransferase [Acidobacteriota bacterium]
MTTFLWALGLILAAVWVHRVVDAVRGAPSVADISTPSWDRVLPKEGAPLVSIIVAGRDEELRAEAALSTLLGLDYPNCEIIAVNDRSRDRTGEIMDQLAAREARLRVLHISELPSGWLGKTHALWRAAQMARGAWLLFTDADVSFRPDALRRAIAYAEHVRADHLVLVPTPLLHGVGERMLLAFFQSLFFFGHRPWKVADPKARDHMGVGAFNLVRRSAYDGIGTHQALRMDVLDDVKLGKLIKQKGFAQRNVIGRGLITLRWAHGAMGIVRNLTKNMFALMLYRWPRTLGAAFLLLVLNLGPFAGVLLAPGWSRIGYGAAMAAIAVLYWGIAPHLGISRFYFLWHPVAALLFTYTLLRSAFHVVRNGGVVWRGTRYSLEELKKGLV